MIHRIVLAALAATIAATSVHAGRAARAQPDAGPHIDITVARSSRASALTGMVYVAISRDNERTPVEQTGPTGAPLFSRYVEARAPGVAVTLDGDDRGHPIASLRDLPAGDYWMQPFVNVYTKFARADGHTVWLHMDQWEGQNWKRSPGNLSGDPVKIAYDPKSTTPVRLVADRVIPPIQPPGDTELVRRIRIQSDILTRWWGHPIYLGATVLLPKGYDAHPKIRYPINYQHGHFSTGAPGGFGRGSEFDNYWLADATPRIIYVTLQHPSPYYDDFVDKGWMRVDRPNQRRPDGNIPSMMKDENHYELVVGDKSRSGGQWDIWEAAYSPVGADGYPRRLWNKATGEIDKSVAETWKKYDLRHILQSNWPALGPRVAHKINVYMGDMDSYYLNNATEKLNAFLLKADNPAFTSEIVFERRAPHCWGPRGADLMDKMVKQIERYAPAGADIGSWRYR